MWGFGGFKDDEYPYSRIDSSEIIKEIGELKGKGSMVTIAEGKRLIELQDKLRENQEKCTHIWSIILLFNRHSRFCTFCDKEDTDYKHEG